MCAPTPSTSQVSGIPPVLYLGHGGLLDVALDPEFAENGIIYLSFLQGEESGIDRQGAPGPVRRRAGDG